MSKMKVGVLGLGSIFHRVMTGFGKAENCELYAVAARDGERAKAEAEKYGAKKWFGSYDELIACPEVDLIYVATPHGLHHEHVLKCLKAGKNVLCEKAFTLNAAQAKELIDCARENNVFLMEAMWTRFLPAMRKLMEILEGGEYGTVKHVYADFAFPAPFNPEGRMYNPALGGGAMLDVGIYPLSIFNMIMGGNPVKVESSTIKAATGVDGRDSVQLTYANGATAQFMCSIDCMSEQVMTIYTEKAVIQVPGFWHATSFTVNGQNYEFPPENEGHHHQFEYIAKYLEEGKKESPIMPLDETLALMEIMDGIRLAADVKYPCD